MKKDKSSYILEEDYTSYINDGMVQRRSNIFFEGIVRVLFRKIDFDDESRETLKQYEGKGKTVFASFQSTAASLLIFTSVLKKNNMSLPVLALGVSTYFFQLVTNYLKKAFRFILSVTGIHKYRDVTDEEYIGQVMKADKPLMISLLSGKLFLRRYVEIKTDFIYDLIAIQRSSHDPLYVFPQMIFWNLNPERTDSLISSKATGDRGLISGLVATRKSATPAFIRISDPINLKEEIEKYPDRDDLYIARAVRNRLLEQYNLEKRSVLGPEIKSRQEMMEQVLFHKNVLDEIHNQVSKNAGSEQRLRRKAYNHFREIAADFSINYISAADKILNFVFKKIFSGIYYNTEDFKMLREASQRGPLVILPSHKSHMDYVIISCLFFRNRIMPPHIVAGANLRFFPMGKFFRRSGGFFMRRSFRGLDLYAVIFKQYVKTLVSEGYTIEFFIEGGRTRSGKLLFPKLGILKYLTESIDEGYNTDLMFVPATINYDRILEENSYSGELKGKEKKKESTVGFVKSGSLLKRNYGRVRLSVNTPVSYNELKEQYKDSQNQIQEIAMDLSRRINEITMVTPYSLTTTAILFSSSRGFSRPVLLERVRRLHDYLVFLNVPMSERLRESAGLAEQVEEVLTAYRKDSIIGEIDLDGIQTSGRESLHDIFLINEDDRIKISFYRNTIIHYIVPLSFLSMALLHSMDGNEAEASGVRDSFETLTDLFSREFIYQDIMNEPGKTWSLLVPYLEKRGLLSQSDTSLAVNENAAEELHFYAKIMQDYLESYFIVFETVLSMKSGKTGKKDLVSNIRKNGVRLYHLGQVKLTESLSISNYNNAVEFLIGRDILREETDSNKRNSTLRLASREKVLKYFEDIENWLELVYSV